MAWENAGDDRYTPRPASTGQSDRIGTATRLVGLILAVCLSAALVAAVIIGMWKWVG